MTGLLASIAIGAGCVALRAYMSRGQVLTPDGRVYMMMGCGALMPRPYCLRWLVPRLMRTASMITWVKAGTVATVATFPAMYLFAEAAGVPGLWAVALWGALPVIDILQRLPVLIDPYAWTVGLLTGWAALSGHTIPAVALALLGGLIEPRLPIMVALWTLNPIPLLGLGTLCVLWKYAPQDERVSVICKDTPELDPTQHPWKTGRRCNGSRWMNAPDMLLPWGGLLAALFTFSPAVWLSLAAAYGQVFRATDRVRLYQWAAPALIVATLGVIPALLLPALVLATWFNPCRGEA